MKSPIDEATSRRTVLKTTAVVGTLGLAGLSGTVAASNGDTNHSKDVNAFLNKPAAFKESPIWDGTIVDMTGTSDVDVLVGDFTSVSIPDVPIDMAPVTFSPRAISVSVGTTVNWTWNTIPEIPHDVTAFGTSRANPKFASELMSFHPGSPAPTFSYTFDESGEYLYYCTPHGAPFAVESFLGGKVNNEFGMRGAVVVK